jgi:hypothetical protein
MQWENVSSSTLFENIYFVVVIELMFGNNFPNIFGGFSNNLDELTFSHCMGKLGKEIFCCFYFRRTLTRPEEGNIFPETSPEI